MTVIMGSSVSPGVWLMLLLASILFLGVETHVLDLTPVKTQARADWPEPVFKNLHGVHVVNTSHGERIFLASMQAQEVVGTQLDGEFNISIGLPGSGPSDIDGGVHGVGGGNGRLWIVDFRRSFLSAHSLSGAALPEENIKLESFKTVPFIPFHTQLAIGHHGVVIANNARTSNQLATYYPFKGNPDPFGELIFPHGTSAHSQTPYINDTTWCFDGDSFYGIGHWQPEIRVFNEASKTITGAATSKIREIQPILDRAYDGKRATPRQFTSACHCHPSIRSISLRAFRTRLFIETQQRNETVESISTANQGQKDWDDELWYYKIRLNHRHSHSRPRQLLHRNALKCSSKHRSDSPPRHLPRDGVEIVGKRPAFVNHKVTYHPIQ